MSGVTGLAKRLNLSIEQVTIIMKKLDIPVNSPDYILTTKDVKKIKKYVRRNNGSLLKDIFVTSVAIMSLYFMFTTIGGLIMSTPNNEASTPTTSIFINERSPVQSGIVHYYLSSNECRPVDYSETDFLVVENIKVFLSNEGYYTGTIDEVFNTKLESSVKDFQKDMGIRIDGVVGPTTHKMMQNYDSCSKTSKVTLITCYGGDYKAYLECTSPYGGSAVEASSTSSQDTESPKWGSDSLQLTRVNGTFLDILWGHVTDNNGIDKLHLYVDGELHSSVDGSGCKASCSSTTSETRFKVTNLSVDTSYVFEVVACDSSGNCSKNNPTTAQLLIDKPPVWDDPNPPVVDNLGTGFDLTIPTGSVIDDLGVVSYEVYVNGTLSTHTEISDFHFSVTPPFDTHCGKQEVYVVAYDTAGQSSKSPTVEFTRNAWGSSGCSSVAVATTTTTTTTTNSITSANRWVIAVIDETAGAYTCGGSPPVYNYNLFPGPMHNGICDVNGAWGEFRTLWPNRKFFLIEPWENVGGTTQSLTGLDQSLSTTTNIKMPTAFVTEAQAGVKAVYIQSTRNTGGTDWWSKIGGSSLPSGAEVILWVDNSGSLLYQYVQSEYNAFKAAAAAANVTVTEVTNLTYLMGGDLKREDWINPFDPDYP